MNDPLRLGKEANQRYLMVDVHGFDGENGIILETKPFEDRGRPFEVPVRFEVVNATNYFIENSTSAI